LELYAPDRYAITNVRVKHWCLQTKISSRDVCRILWCIEY